MDVDVRELLAEKRFERAFQLIVERHRNKVFRLATTMLGNTARAEELTQDVFLKLWRALPAYDGTAAPSTWLYTIARNTCLSEIRSNSHRRTLPMEDVVEPSAGESTLERLVTAQLLARLPEEQREVITLFYLQERSVDDVAELLDLPEGTVKSHLYRARRALAAMIKEKQCTATKHRI